MADIAREPDMGYHAGTLGVTEGGGLPGLDVDAGAKLLTVAAPGAAVPGAGGVFGGEGEGRSVLHGVDGHFKHSFLQSA